MPDLTKWQKEFLERIEGYSNDELLDETLDLAQGDDYDGAFTDRGSWQYRELRAELDRRLTDAEWFPVEHGSCPKCAARMRRTEHDFGTAGGVKVWFGCVRGHRWEEKDWQRIVEAKQSNTAEFLASVLRDIDHEVTPCECQCHRNMRDALTCEMCSRSCSVWQEGRETFRRRGQTYPVDPSDPEKEAE